MLAYVFWHWPRPGIGRPDYEATQRAFHDALADDPPRGYLRSLSLALTGASWANAGWDAYEDWYLLHDSAALDRLNDAAISAGRQLPHDAAAAAAAGGTAALYTLRLGAALDRPTHAYWFAKPESVRYDELWNAFGPLARNGHAALWMRRMVLGPSPEFCLQAAGSVTLPSGYAPLHIALRPVWPGGKA